VVDLDLAVAFEETGIWWHPDRPEQKLAGTIKYDPRKGIHLEIVGDLSDQDSRDIQFSSIFGMSENLNAHTLTDVRRVPGGGTARSSYGSDTELETTHYLAEYGFVSHNYESAEEMLIESLTIRLSGLATWLYDLDMMGVDSESDAESNTETISYKTSSIRTVLLSSGHRLDFQTVVGRNNGRKELRLTIASSIHITLNQPMNIQDVMVQLVHPLQEFLDFATGMPCAINSIEVFYAKDRGYPRTLELIGAKVIIFDMQNSRLFGSGYDDIVFLDNELISSSEALGNEGEVIRGFFDSRDSMKDAFRLYLLARHFPSTFPFLELSFLASVNALESYFSGNKDEFLYEEDQWKEVRKQLKKILPKDWRGDVLQQFDYIRHKKLRSALAELFDDANRIARILGEDRKRVIDTIVNSRNYYSHFASDLKAGALESTEAYIAMLALCGIFEALILQKLGFSQDVAVQRVLDTPRLKPVRELKLPPPREETEG
jgi:hypothetical protein